MTSLLEAAGSTFAQQLAGGSVSGPRLLLRFFACLAHSAVLLPADVLSLMERLMEVAQGQVDAGRWGRGRRGEGGGCVPKSRQCVYRGKNVVQAKEFQCRHAGGMDLCVKVVRHACFTQAAVDVLCVFVTCSRVRTEGQGGGELWFWTGPKVGNGASITVSCVSGATSTWQP